MKAINFYTANGWARSNYDSKLSTKEIAANVRAYAKKNFPGFKFSIRTEWSIYTDSMYIELKGGPCVPFVNGTRSAERGYLSTSGSVKPFKDELTPEVFAALDAVVTYASSYRYDDSDGMQDYYDTNFYISIRISDDYTVIEAKTKKAANKKEEAPETAVSVSVPAVSDGLEVVDYSEKAIAIFGDTKAIKEDLKALGGRFNPALNYNGGKRAGWIFSKKKAEEVRKLVAPEKVEEVEELPALPEVVYLPELAKKESEEAYPLDGIVFTEAGELGNVLYYDVEGAGVITSAKVRKDTQPCDVFNVYTDEERKYAVMYDGVSLNRSLYNALPGIIEFDNKINAGMLDASSYYTPMIENVETYEKKVTGKRYKVKEKPLSLGYYGIVDTLDNCMIECYPTKEEAEKEAETLNSWTDENGRLKSVI